MKKMLAAVLALAMVMTASFACAEGAIKIGLIGPMTGPAADYGVSVANGATIAVEEINAKGGIQVELNVQDDEHDPEKSVNAYNNLWDWGAQMIDGTVTTSPCIAVGAEAYKDRMFMLTPSASSTDVIANKDNVYQVCFTDPAQGAASADYICGHKLAEKVAVIYNNADAYLSPFPSRFPCFPQTPRRRFHSLFHPHRLRTSIRQTAGSAAWQEAGKGRDVWHCT